MNDSQQVARVAELLAALERAQAAYRAVPSGHNRLAYERAVVAWNKARGAYSA